MISISTLIVRAIKFLATTPSLWLKLFLPLILVVILSITFTILLFIFLLPIQQRLLVDAFPLSETSIALSWLIAIIITLIESAFGIFILSILLLQKRSDRVFDIVLRKNCPQLYINNENSFGQDNLILGKEFKNSFTEIFCFLLTLPINLLPVIGQGLFIIANGYIQGPRVHTRYFVKKKWSQEEIAKHLSKYRSDYTRFGCAKVLFESVPILNMISEYIFASAAAMWASELENSAVRLNSERL